MPEWLDRCVEKHKDTKGIDNPYAFCQWLKKEGRIETQEDTDSLVKSYRAVIDVAQNECSCSQNRRQAIAVKLEQFGHSKPQEGSARVSASVQACESAVIRSATKAGMDQKEAKKLARSKCADQGKKMDFLS